MHIEPVGPVARGRAGRARLLIAVAAPVVLLVVAVGTATLAPDGRSIADRAPVDLAASAAPPPMDTPAATSSPARAASAFPSRALGLPARPVAEVLELRRSGAIGDDLIAVRGYLTVRRAGLDCVTPVLDPPQAFCRRDTVLRDEPDPVMARTAGELRWIGARSTKHLHPQVFAGVGLGPLDGPVAGRTTAPAMGDGPIQPIAVIVIGRFDDPRLADPRASARHADEGFTIERLVWADGRWQDRRLTTAAASMPGEVDLRDARAIAARALAGGTIILSQSLVPRDTLAALDAAAAGAARAATAGGRLWYLRAMTRAESPIDSLADDGGPRRLGWVVIAGDGTVIGAEPDG